MLLNDKKRGWFFRPGSHVGEVMRSYVWDGAKTDFVVTGPKFASHAQN